METKAADPQVLEHLPEQVAELLANGATLGWIQNYDETDYEALYALGHNLYAQARYQDAVRIFGFLVLQNHLEPRYMNAYASSLQMVGNYLEAIKSYSITSLMDMEDPLPTFHTAECMLALDMVTEAREALGFVISQCKAPQYAELKARALALQALVQPPAEPTEPEARA
jgi:type III secretion system low calcium response chaperone LcrH/SycD